MGIFSDLAGFAGESLRRKKADNLNANLDEDTLQWLNAITQAAENGNIEAMFQLGNAYNEGKKLGYDPDKACFWWTEAAKRQHINAQFNLGLLYHGDVSNYYYDPDKAGTWFYAAAKNGDQESQDMLNRYYKYSNFKDKWVRKT